MKRSIKQSQATARTSKIAEPERALKSYLDTLLLEIDDTPKAPPPKVEVKERLPDADTITSEQSASALETTPVKREEAISQTRIPDWAQDTFQVLLFEVNGIQMGLPLAALAGILSFSGEASQLPGQPAWSLGVIVNRDEKVIVINSAKLLMPERLDENSVLAPQHLLLIGDGQRALAVDSICNTLMVEEQGIQWRCGAGVRPWYAGIIKQELSVLLDIDGVLNMLAS
jgi:purine-binding chemotaxis protein CheW